MARKSEIGILYFPINSDIVTNPKIELVVTEFGPKAWAVLLLLYCKIYRERGYWIDWNNEDLILRFCKKECDLEVSFVKEVVAGCVRRSLFNKEVFDTFGVLTSDRIQVNYFEAKVRNKEAIFIKEFSVKNEKNESVYKLYNNVHIIELNVNILTKKVNISTQKKKEIIDIEEEGKGDKQTHTQDEISLFKKFEIWLNDNAPRIQKMRQPITITEYFKLKKSLDKDLMVKLLMVMQNKKDLHTKYVSAYLTLLNWSKNEFNNTNNQNGKQFTSATRTNTAEAIYGSNKSEDAYAGGL